MQMERKRLLVFAACLILVAALTGCHTTHQYASRSRKAAPPRFINDIYLDGHHKTGAKSDAIQPVARKKEEEPAKPVASTEPPPPHYEDNDKPVSFKPGYEPEEAETAKGTHVVFEQPKEDDETNGPMIPYPAPGEGNISRRESKVLRNKYSEMLQVRPKDITNFPLYQFIDKWYGTDYRLGGCDKDGIDCSGFAQKLYSEVYGIDLSRTAHEQFEDSKHIKKKKKAEEGDLVFFRINSRRITHVGIYLANDYFVHASTSNGVTISNLNDDYYRKYYAGAGRIAE